MVAKQVPGGKRLSFFRVLFLFLFLLAAPMACLSTSLAVPNEAETQAAATYAAEALIARVTIQAGETAVARLTEIASQQLPGSTPTSALHLPVVQSNPETDTPEPEMPVQMPPTLTLAATTAPCNKAAFVTDIGLPSGTQVLVGSNISKGWRIMNSGSCTWGRDYSLVYTGGNLPNPPAAVFLPASTPAGGSIDLLVPFQSPGYAGSFQALFLLRDPAGATFGVGPDANTPLEFRFSSIQGTTSAVTGYDLASDICSANWRSASGRLLCPGAAQDRQGSVQLAQPLQVEGLPNTGSGLWLRPDSSANGYILGQYPAFLVQSGDRFISEIGCLQDNPGCSLTFRLDYQTSDGQSGTFGIWNETSDRNTDLIQVDLSSLAGRSVRLSLQVVNRGSWQAADGFWGQPRIQRSAAASTDLVLSWNRSTSSQSGLCRELKIRKTGFGGGSAQAVSCRDDLRDMGTRSLTTEEYQQVQNWIDRFGKVEVEMYSAAQSNPVTIWVQLDGRGGANANEADIRAIDSFCNAIYNSIIR